MPVCSSAQYASAISSGKPVRPTGSLLAAFWNIAACAANWLADQHSAGERELVLQYPHRALVAPRVRVTVEFLLDKLTHNEALHVLPQALRAFAA
ncbi:MAG: hypothetical protein ACHP7O_06950 [Burkholderiales bacterium]